MVWLLGFQCIKHQVYGVFELLVILPDFHRIDELNEGGEVLLLHRSLIVDIANERAVQQRLRFDPEIVASLAFAFGIGDQRRNQLQDVLFAVNVRERIVVHTFFEVDGIQHLDAVRLINDLTVLVLHGLSVLSQLGCAPLEHFSALDQNGSLRVCDHIRTVHLHQI